MEYDLTSGSVWKTLVRFSIPFILSYFLQTLYGMADLFIIGQFCGVESTTAVSTGSQVMHMLTVMIVGLSMGTVVVTGQAAGAYDRRRVASSVGSTITLFLSLSAVLTVVLFVSAGWIVSVMSTPEEAVDGAVLYLKICFLGIPFIISYNMISSVLRGLGDSRSPMYFIAASCVINIVLDYIFIGYADLGTAGAALGTVFSQTASVFIALAMIKRRKNDIGFSLSDLKPERDTMKKILYIGIPVALQDGFIQISFILITVFANLRGIHDAAAVGIVEKLIGIFFLVPSSMLQAVSAISAHNIGAGLHDRARRTLFYACAISVIWGLMSVTLMHFRSYEIIGLFTDDAETVAAGSLYAAGYIWDCLFAGIHFSFSGYFYAYGMSGLSFMHNALSNILVRIPFSYFAAKYFVSTLLPMGLASTAGSVLSVLICIAAYFLTRSSRARACAHT